MTAVKDLLKKSGSCLPPLPEEEGAKMAQSLTPLAGVAVYPRSLTGVGGVLFFLGRDDATDDREKKLCLLFEEAGELAGRFSGVDRGVSIDGQNLTLRTCPTDHANALALRKSLPFTAPVPLWLSKSFGCGDRLGLATPGHIRAIRKYDMRPIFAQQSIREMRRTLRTSHDVMDDASWGVFQEGWRDGFGSDADHLKTPEDVRDCAGAGYTLYTIDPGDHVDNEADSEPVERLREKVKSLPWDVLETSEDGLRCEYVEQKISLPGEALVLTEEQVLRAAAKYGRAIAHTVKMHHAIVDAMGGREYEVEMSVDETDTPTTPAEHFFVASELKRLGVEVVSLAPRFIGRFEKSADYIGDIQAFEVEFAKHAAIARMAGPYKISLHTGSDKFSVYPIMVKYARELCHVKTAGTSYLEALRAIATVAPDLFRDILSFAIDHYETDRATYLLSAEADRVSRPEFLEDDQLVYVLDDFHGREVLHATFGSVLTAKDASGKYIFRRRFFDVLRSDEEAYYDALEAHFDKHIAPFAGV